MWVKFRYALNKHNEITDVDRLTKLQYHAQRPFHCFGCDAEMIARLGDIKEHHFAHKRTHGVARQDCSNETYLHRAAKHAFYQIYCNALQQQSTYNLQYFRPYACNYYQEALGFDCSGEYFFSYNLTKYFTSVALEATLAPFRADILLSSDKHQRNILVEICVTHPCSEEKLASGHPIIEIEVKDELAIKRLLESRFLSETDSNVHLHNFERTLKPGLCAGRCKHNVAVFLVHQSQQSVIAKMNPEEYISGRGFRANPSHVEYIGKAIYDNSEYTVLFKEKVTAAFFGGVPVKNCFLCRFHGADDDNQAVFCKKLLAPKESNAAAECPKFWPFNSLEEYISADIVNAEYKQNRKRSSNTGYWDQLRIENSGETSQVNDLESVLNTYNIKSKKKRRYQPSELEALDERKEAWFRAKNGND